jgi:selenide,water dikinase
VLDALPRDSAEFARLLETREDAAVTRLSDDLCLVQTVDFFTPIVDSAYRFGQLAAANALSDIYAMGARPLTAMNLVAWPASLGMELLAEVLRGGLDKVREAGAEPAGGHSIDDAEPKYGLAVTGVARPDEIVTNAGAQAGDVLVLTKRLGIGVLASALKQGEVDEDDIEEAIDEAAALNAAAARVMAEVGVHACTDVSGFGLAGHLAELLDAGGVSGVLDLAGLPLHERVPGFIERGVYAGGLRANRDYLLPRVQGGDPGDPRVLALFDPQTSGGLLMAVPPEKAAFLMGRLELAGAGGDPPRPRARRPPRRRPASRGLRTWTPAAGCPAARAGSPTRTTSSAPDGPRRGWCCAPSRWSPSCWPPRWP